MGAESVFLLADPASFRARVPREKQRNHIGESARSSAWLRLTFVHGFHLGLLLSCSFSFLLLSFLFFLGLSLFFNHENILVTC